MIFLDSWVWLEYLFDGERADDAATVIQRADSPDVGGLISPTVIGEVAYRVRVELGESTAARAIEAIHDFEHIDSLPLVDKIAEHAAELRYRLYQRGSRELSYADVIHIATANLHDECDVLYSGDPDFENLAEIETVVI